MKLTSENCSINICQVNNPLIEQLEEIRKLFPDFGYSGKAGWVDEEDNLADWDEE